MDKALVTVKGQIVIPSKLRRKFGIKKGAQVYVYERDGKIFTKPITDDYIRNMAGMAGTKGGSFSNPCWMRSRRMRRYRPQVVVDDSVGFEQSNGVDLLYYGRRGHDAHGTVAGDDDARMAI
jgi:AbrB family looped-hinge helix DNA binding protein